MILGAGRATLELSNRPQIDLIDTVEVGRTGVSGKYRLAFEVDDSASVTDRLTAAGAELIAPPTVTPWRSLNARLQGPADVQLTIFTELGDTENQGVIMTTPTRVSGFGPAATQFFEDLEDQNTREFWLAHKDVFDREVREPMAALLDSLPEEYQPFKVFRMNRDVRFSADKSPYKTMHGAAHGVPGAVHYLHLDASGLMVACGSYMMPPDELERYRRRSLPTPAARSCPRFSPSWDGAARALESGWSRAAEDGAARLPTRPSASRPAATEGPDRNADSAWLGLQNGARLRAFVIETFEMCADLTDWLRRYRTSERRRAEGRPSPPVYQPSVSHAAWDVHAVHGMYAMYSVNGLGTARRLIKLSGRAPDLLPTLVPYARTSDRRSTGYDEQGPGDQPGPGQAVGVGSGRPQGLGVDAALGDVSDERQQHAAAGPVEQPGVPEGDHHGRRDVGEAEVELRHEDQWQVPARDQQPEHGGRRQG